MTPQIHESEQAGPRSELGPLNGLRVIDMTTSYAGPTASMYLADLGADVVKVEKPGTGDDARGWGPPFVDQHSAWFASANRGKRSVVVDIQRREGIEVLRRMLLRADVFMANTNPKKLESRGLGYSTMTKMNPRLICCAMSGYGLTGPDSHLPGYDLVAQARFGLMSVTGADGGPPQRVSTALSDVVTGMSAAIAINAAVVRQRTEGRGELIDVSLLDSVLALMAPRIASFMAGEAEPAPSGGTDSVLAVYQSFQTADRDIIIAVGNDAMWRRLCVALRLDDLADRAELADNAGRRRHRATVVTRISERLVERPAREWLDILEEAQVPCAPVQSLSEVVKDPQVVARGSLVPALETAGQLTSVQSPFRLASVPGITTGSFPRLGQHTREVLPEYGFTAPQIQRLITEGVVDEGS